MKGIRQKAKKGKERKRKEKKGMEKARDKGKSKSDRAKGESGWWTGTVDTVGNGDTRRLSVPTAKKTTDGTWSSGVKAVDDCID